MIPPPVPHSPLGKSKNILNLAELHRDLSFSFYVSPPSQCKKLFPGLSLAHLLVPFFLQQFPCKQLILLALPICCGSPSHFSFPPKPRIPEEKPDSFPRRLGPLLLPHCIICQGPLTNQSFLFSSSQMFAIPWVGIVFPLFAITPPPFPLCSLIHRLLHNPRTFFSPSRTLSGPVSLNLASLWTFPTFCKPPCGL